MSRLRKIRCPVLRLFDSMGDEMENRSRRRQNLANSDCMPSMIKKKLISDWKCLEKQVTRSFDLILIPL